MDRTITVYLKPTSEQARVLKHTLLQTVDLGEVPGKAARRIIAVGTLRFAYSEAQSDAFHLFQPGNRNNTFQRRVPGVV